MHLSQIIFFYLPSFLILYFITQNLVHKFQNLPPNPFITFPIIGHIYLLQKPLHKKFYCLSKKYGPIFTLQLGCRRVIIVNSPSAAEECLSKTNDAVFANRPRLIPGKHLGYNYKSITWAPNGDHWRNLRRISSIELLSSNRIQELFQIRRDEVKFLIQHLFRACFENPCHIVDFRPVVFELFFNILTRMILGKRYYGKKAVNSAEAEEFRDIINDMNRVFDKSTLEDLIPFLRLFGKADDEYKALQERRDKFLQDLIEGIRGKCYEKSSSDGKDQKTMIEVLLSLSEMDPEYYTDEMIKSLTAVLLQAGSDNSMATLEWAMTLLLNNPTVLKNAQAEIDNLVGHNRLIDESDLPELPYLHCIVNETFRLYPPSPLLLPHESSQQSTVGGFSIPQGTMLLINAWAIQNDPMIWENPKMFKPERFMELDGKKEGFKFLSFGSGRRGCPGEALARRMIGLALGSLLQCFDWERVSLEIEDMDETSRLVTIKTRPLMAKCKPRPCTMNFLSELE